MYECRCNGRLQTKRFTRLAHIREVLFSVKLFQEGFGKKKLFVSCHHGRGKKDAAAFAKLDGRDAGGGNSSGQFHWTA